MEKQTKVPQSLCTRPRKLEVFLILYLSMKTTLRIIDYAYAILDAHAPSGLSTCFCGCVDSYSRATGYEATILAIPTVSTLQALEKECGYFAEMATFHRENMHGRGSRFVTQSIH